MITRTSANEAAAYLVWLAAHECVEDPDYLTPLKLQKLLYYLQGWSIAEWNRPFFHEQIQAWKNGPVVPEVYAAYKNRERLPIIPDLSLPPPSTLTDAERAMARSVWNAYKRHSAWMLKDLTHREPAYLAAYSPSDAQDRCRREIPQDRIKRDFTDPNRTAGTRLAEKRAKLRAFAKVNTQKLSGRDSL